MKNFLTICLSIFFISSSLFFAQDTLVVEPFTGDPGYISLTEIIHGDTLADGTRKNLNRVYKLVKGGFYLLDGRVDANEFDLVLIGEKGDETTAPPTIAHDVDEAGGHAFDMFRVGMNATFKNILFNASDINDSPSKRFIDINSLDSKIIIDNCVFVNFLNRLIDLRGTVGTSIFVTNNLAINVNDSNNEWGAHIFHTANTDGDTMWVQNNTFFNFGHNGTAPGTQFNFSWWNHNTFVNFGHRLLGHDYNQEHYFTENVLYNISIVGEDSTWFPDAGGTWEAVFGLVDSDTLAEGPNADRVLWYDANSVQNSEAFDLLYDNYSGNTQRLYVPIMGERLEWIINDDATWPNAGVGNWYDAHPTFTDEAVVVANLEKQVLWALEEWADSTPVERTNRIWDMDGDNRPITTPWPIPLDLSFTNSELLTAGHGQLPIGDLNWFPAEKMQWEASKEIYEQKIKNFEPAIITDVDDVEFVASEFYLHQNYPNPFNPSTNIKFNLKKSSDVKISIYDILGQEVAVLVNTNMNAGSHNTQWNGTDRYNNKVNSGMYFYKLEADNFIQVRKMMLLK